MAIEKQQPLESHKTPGAEHSHITHALDEVNQQRRTDRAQKDQGAPNRVDQADTRKKDVAADHLDFSNPFTNNQPESSHTGFPGAGPAGADKTTNAKGTNDNGDAKPLNATNKELPAVDQPAGPAGSNAGDATGRPGAQPGGSFPPESIDKSQGF